MRSQEWIIKPRVKLIDEILSKEDFIKRLDKITMKLNCNEGHIAKYKIDSELVEYIVSAFGTIIYHCHFPFDVYNYTDILNEIESDFKDHQLLK
jgi:hypothetical protein